MRKSVKFKLATYYKEAAFKCRNFIYKSPMCFYCNSKNGAYLFVEILQWKCSGSLWGGGQSRSNWRNTKDLQGGETFQLKLYLFSSDRGVNGALPEIYKGVKHWNAMYCNSSCTVVLKYSHDQINRIPKLTNWLIEKYVRVHTCNQTPILFIS